MNKKLLGVDLDSLIKESLKGLFESSDTTADMQEKLAQELAKSKATKRKKAYKGGDESEMADEGEEVVPTKPVKIKHEKLPDINAEAIADKINNIRSGKSLKEKETMSALKTYFEKLNGPERIALFAFLAGLEKVLGDAADNVKTPHAAPFNIDMEQEKPQEKETKPKGSKESSKNNASDTPIIVGESANKSNILKVMKSNRR